MKKLPIWVIVDLKKKNDFFLNEMSQKNNILDSIRISLSVSAQHCTVIFFSWKPNPPSGTHHEKIQSNG